MAYVTKLRDAPCEECGGRFPTWVMEFDHVRGIKVANVSVFVQRGDMLGLLEELTKCELVCANCHRDREHKRGNTRGRKSKAHIIDALFRERPAKPVPSHSLNDKWKPPTMKPGVYLIDPFL